MAIFKLGNTSAFLSPNQVSTFLNEHKAGTFLENMTITASGDLLTISSEHANIRITNATGSNVECVKYTSTPGITKSYTTAGTTNSYCKLYQAILCTHGLIILLSSYDGNVTYPRRVLALSADTNGELACVMPYITGSSSTWITSTLAGYSVCAAGSTSTANVTLTTNFNAQLTSIAPVVAANTDRDVTIPNVYAALHSQQPSAGLAAVVIGSQNYITDGTLYIKDGV